jgi:hypothetical protein
MPTPAVLPQQTHGAPASHHRKSASKGSKGKIIAISAIVVVLLLLVGVGAVMKISSSMEGANRVSSPSQANNAAAGTGSGNAQTANATLAGEIDSPHPGWIGVQELYAEQATVTLVTYSDQAKAARDFAANVGDPASVASIAIDNTHGKVELAVDTMGASMKMTDGTTMPTLDPGTVLATARQNAETVKGEILGPFTCPAGQKMTGKLLLLPHGTDPHKLAAITVRINGQTYEIIGVFSNDGKRVEQMRAGQPPTIPAGSAPAPATAAPASRPS